MCVKFSSSSLIRYVGWLHILADVTSGNNKLGFLFFIFIIRSRDKPQILYWDHRPDLVSGEVTGQVYVNRWFFFSMKLWVFFVVVLVVLLQFQDLQHILDTLLHSRLATKVPSLLTRGLSLATQSQQLAVKVIMQPSFLFKEARLSSSWIPSGCQHRHLFRTAHLG